MSEQTEDYPVLFEKRGHVGIVTMDRPKQLNAVSAELTRGMRKYILQIEADPDIRVGVLASSQTRAFCAGADLAAIARGEGKLLVTEDGGLGHFVKSRRKKPWIAAVTGFAMGGGFEMAMAADMIVLGEGAKLGLPEAQRGLLAGAGGAFRLPRLLPRAIAIEVLTTGRRITPQEALHYGLVNRVVPDEQLMEATLELAEQVAASAPIAVEEALRMARLANDYPEEALWGITLGASARTGGSNDAKEGAKAFVEKRAPVWTGS